LGGFANFEGQSIFDGEEWVGPGRIYFGKKLCFRKEMSISRLILVEWYFRFFGANVAGLPWDWLKILLQIGGIKHDFYRPCQGDKQSWTSDPLLATLKAAFDSIPRPFMNLALRLLGVPDDVAEWID
jgi:hypothetical protein